MNGKGALGLAPFNSACDTRPVTLGNNSRLKTIPSINRMISLRPLKRPLK